MRKTFMTLFLLLACSAVLAAQSQGQPQSYQPATSSSAQMEKSVTLTGCLAAGKDPGTFVLRSVTKSGMNQGQSSQNKSGAKPSELAKTEPSYALIPEGKVDLKSHLGHKVEVTGMIAESSKSNTSTEMTGQAELKVSSIRHISSTCK
jgi:hypothetical protein